MISSRVLACMVALTALACLLPSAAFPCDNDADCVPCQTCMGGECVASAAVLCTKDADCPAGQLCTVDPQNFCLNMCIPEDGCLNDAECEKCQFCIAGACQGVAGVECTADAQCGAGKVCKVDPDNECNNHCVEEGQCFNDSDCKQCQVCIGGTCTGQGIACTAALPCPLPKLCKIDEKNPCNNVCVSGTGCDSTEDCGACQVCMDGACVDAGAVICDEDKDCFKGFVCKKDAANPCNNQCVPYVNCFEDKDCDQCEACIAGACKSTGPMECMGPLDCEPGEICQKDADYCKNKCVTDKSCNVDDDCGPCEICIGGQCAAAGDIMCLEDSDCPPGHECKMNLEDPCENTCIVPLPECTVDDDCPSCNTCIGGKCEQTGIVGCTEDLHCPEGWVCQIDEEDPCDNLCVPPEPDCITDEDCGVCAHCEGGECKNTAQVLCTGDDDCDEDQVCDNDPDDPCTVRCIGGAGDQDVISQPDGEEDDSASAEGWGDSMPDADPSSSDTTPRQEDGLSPDAADSDWVLDNDANGSGGGSSGGCSSSPHNSVSATLLLLLAVAVLRRALQRQYTVLRPARPSGARPGSGLP